jgi:hypothetical protein
MVPERQQDLVNCLTGGLRARKSFENLKGNLSR